jgi:murein DD-endopeptidase MepM/ murein hydrolase activator NlpD
VLLACYLLVILARPAAADGLVIDTRPAGTAGMQMDAAVLSPQSPLPADVASALQTYTVKPGDTLGVIAERLGTDADTLAKRNEITDRDRITAGQVLASGTGAARPPSLPEDGNVVRMQFWPWPPAQGQAVAVWIQAREPVTYSLTFDGRPYPVQVAPGGAAAATRAWALVPIPPLLEPGEKQLVVQAGDERIAVALPVQAGSFPTINIPGSTSDAILSETKKVSAETARMTDLFGGYSTGTWNARSRFLMPLDGPAPQSAPYGQRRTYGASPALSAHAGQDFSIAAGTPVYAPADGVVVLAEPMFVRGNAIVLDHGQGVFTGYWHLSEIGVKEGDHVTVGQVLGKVGSTGLSTGAHLHWELRIAGMPVDPMQWVEQ